MNWYDLIMGEENRRPNHLMVDREELFGHDWLDDFACGKSIADWDPRSVMRSSEEACDGIPDDILANTFQIPVFSQCLRDALAEYKIGEQDIQFLPVHIFQSTGKEMPGFEIANIVTRVPALNREHSTMLDVDEEEIDPLTNFPRVRGIWTASLNHEFLTGHDVIRLTEFFPPIFVSQRFADVFTGGGFTGATLRKVPVY